MQAIKSYNDALINSHPLRKSLWSRAESLTQKILELKDVVQDIANNLEDPQERKKIEDELNAINFNL